jgi:outer membrane receptor protein involved in Fe transport
MIGIESLFHNEGMISSTRWVTDRYKLNHTGGLMILRAILKGMFPLFIFFVLTGRLLAEEPEEKKEIDLGNVVISEQNNPVADLPASVTIIEGTDLEKLHVKKGIDILRAIPGALPIDYNQGGVPNEFILRGFSGGHGNIVAIFLDGVPLNESTSHADGLADFNVVIPEEIERIEVIKGPFSALYGNYDRAGSINIITKKKVNETTGTLSLGYWGTERGALTIGRIDGRFSQYYAMEYAKSDGWRENSDYSRTNLSAKWIFDINSKSTLRIGGRSYHTDFNAPGYLSGAEWDAGHFEKSLFPFDGGRKDRFDVNINYNYAFGPNDSIGVTAFKYHSDLTRFADFGGGQSEQNNLIDGHIAKILYSKKGRYLTSEDWLLIGADFLREDGTHLRWCTSQRVRGAGPNCTSATPSTNGDFTMDTVSFFTQAEARPVQPLKVTLGARYDSFQGALEDHVAGAHFDNNLTVFSPKGGSFTRSPPAMTFMAMSEPVFSFPMRSINSPILN